MIKSTSGNDSNTNSTSCWTPHPQHGVMDPCGGAMPLKQQLEAALRRAVPLGADKPQSFLPAGDLHRLVTPESVLRTLQHCTPGPDWVRSVFAGTIFSASPKHLKIFAILTLIGRPDAVRKFMNLGISDENLPLESSVSSDCGDDTTLVRSKATHSCFDLSQAGLNTREADAFEDMQWRLLSPALEQLGPEGAPSHFHPKTILPFVWDEQSDAITKSGGHSDVYQVRIHPGHHAFDSSMVRAVNDEENEALTIYKGQETLFAVKELHSTDEEAFEREIEALQRFSDGPSPHIVKLLAAFRRGDTSYLVFPWADTDLQSFWATHDQPTSKDTILTVNQMLGVAEALKAIHYCRAKKRAKAHQHGLEPVVEEEWGYHGDLKPENILVADGEWKLADLGLSRFRHPADSGEDRPLGCSPTYRAPEHDVGAFNGQKADIWSLGCVMSVAATWMTLGRKGVKSFRAKRAALSARPSMEGRVDDSFFEVSKQQGQKAQLKLKPSISHWFNKLHESPTATPLMRDLLDIVEKDMLVVDGAKRITSDELSAKLKKIYFKCSDHSYATPDPHAVESSTCHDTPGDPKAALQRCRSIGVNMAELSSYQAGSKDIFPLESFNLDPGRDKASSLRSFSAPWDYSGQTWPYSQPQSQGLGNGIDVGNLVLQCSATAVPHCKPPSMPATSSKKTKRQWSDSSAGQARGKRRKADSVAAPSPATVPESSEAGEHASPRPCTETASKVLFACPFFKHDQEKYGTKEWTSCGGRGWTIPRLKEHIHRVHFGGGYRCDLCQQRLDTMAELTDHFRSNICYTIPANTVDEQIDEAQWGEIQKRKRGRPCVSKWKEIYQIIFPSEPVPSPYRDEPSLAEFQTYLNSRLLGQPIPEEKLRMQTGLRLVEDFMNSRSQSQSSTKSDIPSLTVDSSNTNTMLFESPHMGGQASPMPESTLDHIEPNMIIPHWSTGKPGAMSERDFDLYPFGHANSQFDEMSGWYPRPPYVVQQTSMMGNYQTGLQPENSHGLPFGQF